MKTRILSLLTILCIAFSSAVFGQEYIPDNIVKRVSCISGYSGCATVPVTLELGKSSTLFYEFQSQVINHPELSGKNYRGYLNKIKITISGRSTTGNYYLPTAIGDSEFIPPTDGLTFGGHAYGVFIEKTGIREFRLSVSDNAL